MNYRDYLQKLIYRIINPLIKGLIRWGVTPNAITTIGFVINIIAAALFVMAAYIIAYPLSILFGAGNPFAYVGWGGAVLLFAGLFDMIDGRLAREGNMSSKFGALWDSTLDRYSELLTLMGVCVVFFEAEWTGMGVVSFLAMVGSVMVSYVRARAEGLGIECKVGLMQRPERVVVTALAAIMTGLTGSLWWLAGGMIIIAVLANITAFWRVAHCHKELKGK